VCARWQRHLRSPSPMAGLISSARRLRLHQLSVILGLCFWPSPSVGQAAVDGGALINPPGAAYTTSDSNSAASSSRLGDSPGWTPLTSTGQYLELNVAGGELRNVRGVVTQGGADADRWTTTFRVETSSDYSSWVVAGTFDGNSDRNTQVTNLFPGSEVAARAVRLYPLTWAGSGSGLRAGLIVAPPSGFECYVVSVRNGYSGPFSTAYYLPSGTYTSSNFASQCYGDQTILEGVSGNTAGPFICSSRYNLNTAYWHIDLAQGREYIRGGSCCNTGQYFVSITNCLSPPPSPPSPPSPSQPSPSAPIASFGDPHLTLAHGARADFRGRHGGIFNFLSADRMSVNVRIENASFYLRPPPNYPNVTVHGTMITEAYIVVRSSRGWLNITYSANEAQGNHARRDVVTACCTSRAPTPEYVQPGAVYPCDNTIMRLGFSTLDLDTTDWNIKIRALPVYDRISGAHHRLDLVFELRKPEALLAQLPHGIIGQSWDGDGRAVDGALDEYPEQDGAHFTTSAMAEGAIEGVGSDYEMSSPYGVAFKYSRFGKQGVAARDVSRLTSSLVESPAGSSAGAAGAGAAGASGDRFKRQPRVEL